MAQGVVDPAIFESLQAKIDEESQIRDKLKEIVQGLEKQVTPTLNELAAATSAQASTIQTLAAFANTQPYYRYNSSWTRQVQDGIAVLLTAQWLRDGRLLTLDEVGASLGGVPVNLKTGSDEFHITVEEYLQALVSVVDELARLAVNSVTLGDFARPLQISGFVKEVFAGFQVLNLKNDALRRRSDSIKYSVKKVEDVVYDLSLRNLIPKSQEKMETS